MINFNQSVEKVYDFVRGLSPYPAAWTSLNGKGCKIYKVHKIKDTILGEVGSFFTDGKKYLHFQCADGLLAVEELQLEMKKRMSIEEFLRGNKLV